MASSLAVCRLHMRGKTSLTKRLQKVHIFPHRCVGTDVAAAQRDTTRTDESDLSERRRPSLHSLVEERQEQADRSVLISCQSRTSESKLLKHLSRHGDIQKCFFYESYGLYAVVEFATRESVSSLLEGAAIPFVNHESVVPFKSRLLSLSNIGSVNSPDQQSGHQCQPQTTIPISELIRWLSTKETIDQQLISLTEAYQITEENSRLRFLVCSLVKDFAAAYFPECNILPFGSTVNGFGKLGCDLDMFLDLDRISGWNLKPKSGLSLEFQMKQASSERAVTQSILSVIAESVDQFGPGCVGVQKILNARCPLVRFAHQPSGFQCDLSYSNRVAMKSTELLYLYGALDPRVRNLVFSVRCWARVHGVTSSIPGAWITNFSLTVMVLFFLQKRNPPIIPTLDHLRDLAGPADKCMIEGNDCTFVSDFSKIQLQSNTETLETLLCEFFEFYASFAFRRKSINIRKGTEQDKPEVAPLHIQNPFETSLNVSKNVNATQLQRFVTLCQESSWMLQQNLSSSPTRGNDPRPWGLACLFLPSQVSGIKSRKKRKPEQTSERIRGLLESLKKKKNS